MRRGPGNRRRRTLVLWGLAATLSLTVVVLVRAALDQPARQSAPAQQARAPVTRQILVAARDLPEGHLVQPEDTSWQTWPESGINDAYIQRQARGTGPASAADRVVGELAGRVVRTRLTEGSPVTRAALVEPGERGFLAAALKPDMRAVTVRLSAVSGVGGFIFPGDRVDVILTRRMKDLKERNRTLSETVLQNVRVLALDQRSMKDEETVAPAETATIEVTPKMAEKVAMLDEMGTLALALRGLERSPRALAEDAEPRPVGRTLSRTLDAEVTGVVGRLGDTGKGGPKVTVTRGARRETVNTGGRQ